MSHKFVVGQTVQFAPSSAPGALTGNCEVLRIMPAFDYQVEPRYRVKNVAERYERVVTESDLMMT